MPVLRAFYKPQPPSRTEQLLRIASAALPNYEVIEDETGDELLFELLCVVGSEAVVSFEIPDFVGVVTEISSISE